MDGVTADLVEDHLDVVERIVREVAAGFPRHVDRAELVQAGFLGLVEAAKRFDATRGASFRSFASLRIRGAILDVARSADWAPRSVRRAARSLAAAEQRLVTRLGRYPSATELATELGVSEQQVKRIQEQADRAVVVCLDRGAGRPDVDGDDFTRADLLPVDRTDDTFDNVELTELYADVREAVAALAYPSNVVLTDLYFHGRSLNDVGEKLGLSGSRICQIKKAALVTLRRKIAARYSDRVGDRLRHAA